MPDLDTHMMHLCGSGCAGKELSRIKIPSRFTHDAVGAA